MEIGIWVAVIEYPKDRPGVMLAASQGEAYRLAAESVYGWLMLNRPEVARLASQEIDHAEDPEAWNEELFSITSKPCVSTHEVTLALG